MHSFETDHKPTNPFDLPYDSVVESTNTVCLVSLCHIHLVYQLNAHLSSSLRQNVESV